MISERIITASNLRICKLLSSVQGKGFRGRTSNGERDHSLREDSLLGGNPVVEVDHKEPCH